jgi:RND family efflux transporter MFP subunit
VLAKPAVRTLIHATGTAAILSKDDLLKGITVNRTLTVISGWMATLVLPIALSAQINGFTQPIRQVELASDEAGLIAELLVDEGSIVAKGDVIARLDDRVQHLQVQAAAHRASSNSALEAARQSLEKRTAINQRLKQLADNGNATESEMIRADLEYLIAQSRYMASQEESVGFQIELKRAELLLERRTIRAPFSGSIATVHRRQGEFLSPLHAEIVTIVDTSRLLAVFNVPGNLVPELEKRETLPVRIGDQMITDGKLHAISVLTDASSGTVQVKIAIDNADGQFRSGEPCILEL